MIREATEGDLERVVALGARMHAESPRYRKFEYRRGKLARLARIIFDSDDGLLLVVEENGALVGMFVGVLQPHYFTDEKHATDLLLYVVPDKRGGTMAMRLIKKFVSWATEKGVHEIAPGISTEVDQERTRALYEALGFRVGGYLMIKDV